MHFIVEARNAWTTNDPGVKGRIASVHEMVGGAHATFLATYLKDKQKNFNQDGCAWWDDYGWWGIAFLRTYLNFSIFGQAATGQPSDDCYNKATALTQGCCLQLAHDSWTVMHDHAWDTGQYTEHPPVPGGCWNYKPANGGVQNTVTNNLYLTLSIRLYLATKAMPGWEARNQQYLQAACDSFKWYGVWFLKGPNDNPNEKVGIFDQIYDSGVPEGKWRYWILERPVDGPTYNITNKSPPYAKQQWTGDQGVFLGGLIGLLKDQDAVRANPSIVAFGKELEGHKLDPDPIHYMELLVSRISWGATRRLFTQLPSVVLHESPLSTDLIDSFYTDMATGKGVFMRYLAYARSYTSGRAGYPDYDGNIVDTAKAICLHPPVEANGFGFIWDDRTGENITHAGTNEDMFLPHASNGTEWNFTIRMIRLDALAAGIPFRNSINV